jgi:hypothetical protein
MLSDPELLIISEILIKIIQNDIKKKTKNVKQEMNEIVKKEYEKLKDGTEVEKNNTIEETPKQSFGPYINSSAFDETFVEFKELIKRKRGRPKKLLMPNVFMAKT